MPDSDPQYRPHFVLQNNAVSEKFSSPGGGGGGTEAPARDRNNHGSRLRDKLAQLEPQYTAAIEYQRQAGLDDGLGVQIEFESFPDIELAFESLARERSGIELLNVRNSGAIMLATVFVPDGKLLHFEKLVTAYLDEQQDSAKGPKNRKLLNTIADIRTATLDALWTDTPDALPSLDSESLWWEVWLPVRKDREAVTGQFRDMASGLDFRVSDGELRFPERTVVLVYGSVDQMKRSMTTLNTIAELRRAKVTADFFDTLSPAEQPLWADNLKARLEIPDSHATVPYVCLLDTGVNNGHPLLAPLLADNDRHTVEPRWGLDDSEGHGTEMAGLAVYGNLTALLSGEHTIDVGHRLESVKILPNDGANSGDAEHHGYLTVEAVQRPLVTAPDRQRLFSMAITTKDNRDRGRPSAWSAALDRLASDAENQRETPKLFIVCAGNILDPNAWAEYPQSNTTDSIHDPAQAWNALSVGAMTDLIHITESDSVDYHPIAQRGGLSPFSTTSMTWQSHWPLKPDVVFEGGNAAIDGVGAVTMPSLRLLTTNANPAERLFTTTNATSAASALAARMAAQLMGEYPDLWPETIRGLIVHSARWSEDMLKVFLPGRGNATKSNIVELIRHCGFGVPDMERAMWSVDNSLIMISEEALNPLERQGSSAPRYNEMNFHELPWPLDELEALGETEVEMRVTLSYFIEPNPSARGVASRYRYESHGLRFDVKRPLESNREFHARLNAAAQAEERSNPVNETDPDWLVGKSNRHRGSIHSDVWRGQAARLASRGIIGVYPALGWWKTRTALKQYGQSVRYSLIVSIEAPGVDVDLYTAIANRIGVPVEVG